MSKSTDIQGHLSIVAQGRQTNQKLEFDPATGKLRVTSTPNPDNVVATKMAGDGFFGLVYTSTLIKQVEESFGYDDDEDDEEDKMLSKQPYFCL